MEDIERLDHEIHKLQTRIVYQKTLNQTLHPSQIRIVMLVAGAGRCNLTDLARIMCVSNASAGTSVRRLEKAGLVARSADDNDLRASYVELTEKGRRYAAQAKQFGELMSRTKYRGFTEPDFEEFGRLLGKIHDNLDQYFRELEGNRE